MANCAFPLTLVRGIGLKKFYKGLKRLLFVEELQKKLKSYKKEQIIFTIHTDIRVLAREVPNELVISNLQNPENLIDFIEQKAMYPGEKKYKLVFKLHDTRILIVVVVVNKNISVVTPIIRYRKWVRRNEN